MILAFNVRELVAFAATFGDDEFTGTVMGRPSEIETVLDQIVSHVRPQAIVLERQPDDTRIIDFTQALVSSTVERFAKRHQITVIKFTPLEWELLNASSEGSSGFEHDAFTMLQGMDKEPQSDEEANAICMAWAYDLRLREAWGA